jgi:hypothetical protein
MPFRHPDRSHDLSTRIEIEVRERLEEAIDFVCLEALVNARRAGGRPAPVADSTADRDEYTAHVSAFLRLLAVELRAAGASPDEAAGDADDARLLAGQVAMARTLPDYWQRFEALSARYLAEPAVPSGGERRSMLARLFGRG